MGKKTSFTLPNVRAEDAFFAGEHPQKLRRKTTNSWLPHLFHNYIVEDIALGKNACTSHTFFGGDKVHVKQTKLIHDGMSANFVDPL